MLLIGDVHINNIFKQKIIDSINEFINKNEKEDHIVFLGDFVYHFSYDRKAILSLFELFLQQYLKGKNIYVLAGNHDWISETYIFQEAKQSFDILNQFNTNKIYFITSPSIIEIQSKKCLFLPYNIHCYDKFELYNDNLEGTGLKDLIIELKKSKNQNERISGYLNHYLISALNDNVDYVFHHHYFINTSFPGQKSVFSYKDVGISDMFLGEEKKEIFISGHLHSGFTFKNYFCSGSIWNTSPLEDNDFKFMYNYNLKTNEILPFVSDINYYLTIIDDNKSINNNLFDTNNQIINNDYIISELKKNWKNNINQFVSSKFILHPCDFHIPNLNRIIIYIKSENLGYDDLKNKFDKDVIENIKEIKIKKYISGIKQLENILDLSSKDLQNSLSDWKNILLEYLNQKYGNNNKLYIEKLKELGIL